MSGWNYRIFVETDADGYKWYSIHEVYYDELGQPDGWSEYVDVEGDSVEEVRRTLALMTEALDKPVLRITDDEELVEAEDG